MHTNSQNLFLNIKKTSKDYNILRLRHCESHTDSQNNHYIQLLKKNKVQNLYKINNIKFNMLFTIIK